MKDPVRLIDTGESLSADERRALMADSRQAAPLGAKHAIWAALIVKVSAGAAAAAAPGVAAGAAATAPAAAAGSAVAAAGAATDAVAKLTLLSLVKAVGIGGILGAAVSTELWVAASSEPTTTVAAVASGGSAPHATATLGPSPAAPLAESSPSVETSPQVIPSSLPLHGGAVRGAILPRDIKLPDMKESQRVAQARMLLRSGEAAEALHVLRGLERDEPAGLLVQEREALLIEALSAVGERRLARERAALFVRLYPASPHIPAVQRAAE